jgi:hypothetical protein
MKLFYFILFYFILFDLVAQKEDNVWISGYMNLDDSTSDKPEWKNFGTTFINFNSDTPKVTRYWHSLDMNRTNSAYCDTSGTLLMYSNGVKVYNKYHKMMLNGDSLNAGYELFVELPDMYIFGYRSYQGVVILPKPYNDSIYYFIHSLLDSDQTNNSVKITKIYYTEVNIKGNNDSGFVVSKNNELIFGDLNTSIKACRHSNGIDWWIPSYQSKSNCHKMILLDSGGFHINDYYQCIGDSFISGFINTMSFSPDGKKLIIRDFYQGIYIYDFNRCIGRLSNFKKIFLPYDGVNYNHGYISISSNNRFLYYTNIWEVYQFDLWALNIPSSKEVVGVYDGYFDNDNPHTMMHSMQLAPNGKIYVGTGNSTQYYHIIDSPDLKGKACAFRQRGLKLPTFSLGVPNYPNYRLGKGECDSSSSLLKIENEKLKIYPNPVSDWLNVEFEEDGFHTIEIMDITGRVLKYVNSDSKKVRVDLREVDAGTYVVHVKDNNGLVVFKSKVIKE